jgi:hypothetical protein
MNANTIINSTPLTQGCATPRTPVCSPASPVAPWAPERVTRNVGWNSFAINLSAEMDGESSESEYDLAHRLNALVFPEMDAEDNGYEYQEHYTLPEDQLYGNEDAPHPNITLFRGSNPVQSDDEMSELDLDSEQEDDDADTVIAPLDAAMDLGEDDETVVIYPSASTAEEEEEEEQDEEQEEVDYGYPSYSEEEEEHDADEDRQREIQQIKCGPEFKFVEMNYRDTQGKYPKCCAMCHDTMKYDNVYETSCEHALCCDCYNNHEDASAARCHIIRQGFLSCPVRSCRKTIRKVTGYKKRKDEKLFLSDPSSMVYCKETGYWVPASK